MVTIEVECEFARHCKFSSGEHGVGYVQGFEERPGVRLVVEIRDADGKGFPRAVGQDGRFGGEQGAEVGAWVAFLSLSLGDAGYHGGFGSIGDKPRSFAVRRILNPWVRSRPAFPARAASIAVRLRGMGGLCKPSSPFSRRVRAARVIVARLTPNAATIFLVRRQPGDSELADHAVARVAVFVGTAADGLQIERIRRGSIPADHGHGGMDRNGVCWTHRQG